MRIIKAGKIETKNIKCTCKNCGCRFEFEPKEGRYVGQQGPRPDDGNFYYVTCPQQGCKTENIAYP